MPMNASGPLTLAGSTSGSSVLYELGGRTTLNAATGNYTQSVSLDNSAVRNLADDTSGAVSLSNVYNQTARFDFTIEQGTGGNAGYYWSNQGPTQNLVQRSRLGYSYGFLGFNHASPPYSFANATTIWFWSSVALPVSGFANSWAICLNDANLQGRATADFSFASKVWAGQTYVPTNNNIFDISFVPGQQIIYPSGYLNSIYFNTGVWPQNGAAFLVLLAP